MLYILGTIIPALGVLSLSFISMEHKYLSVALFSIGQGVTDFATTGGYYPTLLDLAAPFAGLLLGIANSIAFVASAAAALTVGYITTTVGDITLLHIMLAYLINIDQFYCHTS